VQQSSGYVWAESEAGAGTRVTVCLPLEDALPGETAPAAGPAAGQGRETVLVVEDEPTVRAITVRTLQEHGYQVLEAEDGAAALEVLEREGDRVAAVVSDVVMPRMGGRELAARMAAAGRAGVPVLFISGFAGEDVIRRGLLAPEQPFLQKPFSPEELIERVQGLLTARRG
jgi:CheY-like chemotaxis protein